MRTRLALKEVALISEHPYQNQQEVWGAPKSQIITTVRRAKPMEFRRFPTRLKSTFKVQVATVSKRTWKTNSLPHSYQHGVNAVRLIKTFVGIASTPVPTNMQDTVDEEPTVCGSYILVDELLNAATDSSYTLALEGRCFLSLDVSLLLSSKTTDCYVLCHNCPVLSFEICNTC